MVAQRTSIGAFLVKVRKVNFAVCWNTLRAQGTQGVKILWDWAISRQPRLKTGESSETAREAPSN